MGTAYGPGSRMGVPEPKGFENGKMSMPNPYDLERLLIIQWMGVKIRGIIVGQDRWRKAKATEYCSSDTTCKESSAKRQFRFKDTPKLQPVPQTVPSATSFQGITPIDQDNNLPLTNDPYKIIDKLAPVIIGGALILAPELLPAIAPAAPFLRPVLLSL